MSAYRIFKTRYFSRWMRKSGLTNAALLEAVREMHEGLIDADLGGGVIKKRVALAGRGKRAGARTLVATNKGSRWFFLFGFEKNSRDNVSETELQALQDLAHDLLARSAQQLTIALQDGSLEELVNEKN